MRLVLGISRVSRTNCAEKDSQGYSKGSIRGLLDFFEHIFRKGFASEIALKESTEG